MSAVTASIVVGSRHRKDPGIQPRWLVLLHEGQNYAWHLLRLQLTGVPGPPGLDLPPGVLWRGSGDEHLVEELALMLHLYATHTAEVTEAVRHCPSLRKARVDLDTLQGRERGDMENARRIAAENGRELLLAVTIHRQSRLTEEALLAMPDWELDIAHTDLTRHWKALDGFSITDYRQMEGRALDHETPYDDWVDGHDPLPGDEPAGERAADEAAPAERDERPEPEPEGNGATRPGRLGWMRRAPKDENVRRSNTTVVGRPVREKIGLAEFFGFDDERRD